MKLDADSTKATRTIGQTAGPWNRGKLVGQKPPLKLREVWSIGIRLQLSLDFSNVSSAPGPRIR